MTVIPELEDISKLHLTKQSWSPEEIDTLLRYYRKVPIEDLMRHLPGRKWGAIRVKVSELKNKKLPKEVSEE